MSRPAVLMSIQPKWCELIASGKKTIEVRKGVPDEFTIDGFEPFKVLMYCTQQKAAGELVRIGNSETARILEKPVGSAVGINKDFCKDGDIPLAGTVFGEFTCCGVIPLDVPYPAHTKEFLDKHSDVLKQSCLNYQELHTYAGRKRVYGLQIKDVKIYDNPKSIFEYELFASHLTLNRPPQSWCYVKNQ